MANLKGLVSRLTSNRGAGGVGGGKAGHGTGGKTGDSSQDEAIGRGIKKLLRRVR